MTVGMSGKPGMRVLPVWHEAAKLAGLDLRRHQRGAADGQIDVAGERVVHQRPAAAIGHVHHFDAGALRRAAPW